MILINADIWSMADHYKCVTTNGSLKRNGDLVMGAGLALQAAKRFPGLPSRLGYLVKMFGNKSYILDDLKIISLPTKEHWKDKSDLKFVINSVKYMKYLVDAAGITKVASVKPGSGLGGLSWDDLKPHLDSILDDRFTIVEQ